MGGSSWVVSLFALGTLVSLVGVIYPFKPFKTRWVALASSIACFVLVGVFTPPDETVVTASSDVKQQPPEESGVEGRYWVSTQRLNRRTCPSERCGVVGQLFFREGVEVFERRGGWVRVTKFYDAACVEGQSRYVDAGSASCDPENGIVNGQLAEWVALDFLSTDRPADPAADASRAEALVAGSDDFARYRRVFAEAAQSLIAQGRCTEGDFREMGGWVRSTTHRNQPVYFTYCGGMTLTNRLYLNAKTGEVFR